MDVISQSMSYWSQSRGRWIGLLYWAEWPSSMASWNPLLSVLSSWIVDEDSAGHRSTNEVHWLLASPIVSLHGSEELTGIYGSSSWIAPEGIRIMMMYRAPLMLVVSPVSRSTKSPTTFSPASAPRSTVMTMPLLRSMQVQADHGSPFVASRREFYARKKA